MAFRVRQKKLKVKIEGGQEIARRLKNMSEEAGGILLRATQKGGNIALQDARENCPVDTGALKANLKITDGKSTPTRAEVKVDYDKSMYYGTFVELGVRGRAPNPFLRNAVDDNLQKINETIVKEVGAAVGRKM